MKEMVGGCCVCSDDRGWSENPLVYCDGQSCTVAVHQACYGIVTVPTGPWYCRKCESQERSVKVKCELCPSKYGALKRTDNSGWAHVVCALYIPEVRFGNVTTMEPIQLQLIPAERFNKICYICEEKGKPANSTVGACMQCNKAGCKQQFHVTCAQGLGLLCEEAGNYFDNVKYCGYCQHHYSKLKKGGNVKTIPPYKPVANEAHNSDSNSEKEAETGSSKNASPPVNKKRSSVGNKPAPSKNSGKSSNSQQRAVHNSSKSEKTSKNSKSAKTDDTVVDPASTDKKEVRDTKSEPVEEVKDIKSAKKRKVNSRTPTPVSASEVSVVVTAVTITSTTTTVSANTSVAGDRKNSSSEGIIDKAKKLKIDTTQSIVTNQPVIALTSISTIKASSPTVVDTGAAAETQSLIQTAQTHPPAHPHLPSQSLVVSVPLVNTSLSPHHGIVGSASGVAVSVPVSMPERSSSVGSAVERMSVISGEILASGNSNQGILTSDMSGGGLKIGYEKQVDTITTEEDMELELEPSPSTIVEEPVTRSRAHSAASQQDKPERGGRGKKRNSAGASNSATTLNNSAGVAQKRSSRSRHVSPSPERTEIDIKDIKESPPRTPSPEEASTGSRGRTKGRKGVPASVVPSSSSGSADRSVDRKDVKDVKDVKLFQNGLTAPHMLGNQLNPSSTMHSKMTDHLSSELEAHSIYNPNEGNPNLIGPPLQHKVVQSARASSTGSSTASGSSGLSNMLGGGGGSIPQTLDQLLERQWEQGSQFLMEQAQHFDIASLLSCLHQLRAENMRLEEHVSSLLQRRDHLLAVNARLAIPLTGQPSVSQPCTTNNIHPAVAASHEDLPRPHGRSSSSNTSRYSDPIIGSHEEVRSSHSRSGSSSRYSGLDNGLPEVYPQVVASQQSPTVRHSPVGTYQNSANLHRQGAETGGRTAPRPQAYQLYDRPGPSSQQMVIRERGDRDSDMHHMNSSKPS